MKKISRRLLRGYKRGPDRLIGGLERQVSDQLKAAKVPFKYEPFPIRYEIPTRTAPYTPDFQLENGVIIETKGYFKTSDRKKHLLVQAQHPEFDIRFVFSNPNQRISKQSKTTYAAWCEKHGFKYAKGFIPQAWIDEKGAVK